MLIFVDPPSFIDIDSVKHIDLQSWSDRFSWREDPWNGLRDTAQPVPKTLQSGEGDCEDYAFVAASKRIEEGCTDVSLGLRLDPTPAHVVVHDGDRIYSSGVISEEPDRDQYARESRYSHILWRNVSPRGRGL